MAAPPQSRGLRPPSFFRCLALALLAQNRESNVVHLLEQLCWSLHTRPPCARAVQTLNRSVRPVLNSRNTRWPFTKTLADQENRTQRLMLARFVQIDRMPCKELADYCRRKMRVVGNLARHLGLWGIDHARRVIAWAEHPERPQNSNSLA